MDQEPSSKTGLAGEKQSAHPDAGESDAQEQREGAGIAIREPDPAGTGRSPVGSGAVDLAALVAPGAPVGETTTDGELESMPQIAAPEEEAPGGEAEPELQPGAGPNWMLAFVCLWAGATSLHEAWVIGSPAKFGAQVLRNPDFLGYSLLGIGLLFFALEALQWGRRPLRPVLLAALSVLLTLGGLIELILSHSPGRRI